jgi:hypothetical protein
MMAAIGGNYRRSAERHVDAAGRVKVRMVGQL